MAVIELCRLVRKQSPHDLGSTLNCQQQGTRWCVWGVPMLLPITQRREWKVKGFGKILPASFRGAVASP